MFGLSLIINICSFTGSGIRTGLCFSKISFSSPQGAIPPLRVYRIKGFSGREDSKTKLLVLI